MIDTIDWSEDFNLETYYIDKQHMEVMLDYINNNFTEYQRNIILGLLNGHTHKSVAEGLGVSRTCIYTMMERIIIPKLKRGLRKKINEYKWKVDSDTRRSQCR
jgi:hypothetical protein